MKYARLRRHDIRVFTRFNKDWFRHSNVDRGIDGQQGDLIIQLSFFQNKENSLKMTPRPNDYRTL
jgi:hypothetical protein